MDTINQVLSNMISAEDGYRGLIPKTPIKKLIKNSTDLRVSDDAAKWLAYFLEELVIEISKESIKFTSHGNRKTIRSEDLKLTFKVMKK